MTTEFDAATRQHLLCNITALAQVLAEAETDAGFDLMYGDPESNQRAYSAYQVWAVSEWLAIKLKMRAQRVERIGDQYYWARENKDPVLHRDPILAQIIKTGLEDPSG